MDSSELKIELFRKIDSLSSESLQKVYGKILNFLNSQDDTEEWEALTGNEQKALLDGIHHLEQGKKVPHEQVMKEAREKYQKNEESSGQIPGKFQQPPS